MKAAIFYAIATLLNSFDFPNDRSVNFTQYTSGRCSIRFMDGDGTIRGYTIYADGTYTESNLEV